MKKKMRGAGNGRGDAIHVMIVEKSGEAKRIFRTLKKGGISKRRALALMRKHEELSRDVGLAFATRLRMLDTRKRKAH